jgi:predicted CoA-binding protein
MTTKEILEKYKQITVVGMSTNPRKYAHSVPMFMFSQGYNVVAVNPFIDNINGIKSYKKIADVEEKIEILDVFRPSEACLDVVKEAVERKKEKGDIEVIWLQLGIVNNEAKKLAEDNDIIFIQDKCLYREYNQFF